MSRVFLGKTIKLFLGLLLIPCLNIMAADVWDGTRATNPYTSGSGTIGSPYLIYHANELAQLAYKVNSGTSYAGNYFKLMDDIDLDNRNWTPIGKSDKCFSGNFDGNGHSVTNLKVETTTNKCAGLFGYAMGTETSSVVIENLSVQGSLTSNESGYVYMGGICANFSSYRYTGGASYPCEIKSCVSNVEITQGSSSGYYLGGICGSANYHVRISKCTNKGNVSGYSYIGGICGEAHAVPNEASQYTYSITNCSNAGAIKGSSSVGGICGHYYAYCYQRGSVCTYKIDGCSNSGKIIGKDYKFGGICGHLEHDVSWNSAGNGNIKGDFIFTNCVNTGSIVSQTTNTYGTNKVGGVCGSYDYELYTNSTSYGVTGNVTISNLQNKGSVSGGYTVGGVFGEFYHSNSNVTYNISSTVTVDCCSNTGDVTATGNGTGTINEQYPTNSMTGFVGGIFGRFFLTASLNQTANWHLETLKTSIAHCHNSGNVSAATCWVGGIVGYLQGTKTSDNKPMTASLQYSTNCGYVSSSYNGNSYVGGICGYNNGHNGTTNSDVKYCFNSGVVKSAGNYVGGICGYNQPGSTCVVYCLNAGNVRGGSNVAAINGYGACGSNCYWDKQMCPTTYWYGTTTGASYSKLTQQLIGQNAIPSSSYFTSRPDLYPIPNAGSCSLGTDIDIVASTPIYLLETENVEGFLNCATVSTENDVVWTYSNGDIISVDNETGDLSPNAQNSSSDITVSLNDASRIIDLTTGSVIVSCCQLEPEISGNTGDLCQGQTMTLNAGTGYASYSWTAGSGGSPIGTSATLPVTPQTTTTYTVLVSDANGCTATATSVVAVIICCEELESNPSFTTSETEVGNRTVHLEWQAIEHAARYVIRYGTQNGIGYEEVSTTETSIDISQLTNDHQYFFQISAVGEDGYCITPFSNQSLLTPLCDE